MDDTETRDARTRDAETEPTRENVRPFARHREGAFDVVVVGGGVLGCAIARELAPDRDVLVLEQGELAGNASGLAGGIVSPSKFLAQFPDAARYATDFFRDFDGTGAFRLTERSRLGVVPREHEAAMRDRATTLAEHGFPVSFHERAALEDAYPTLDASEFVGAIEYRDHGWVDPYVYTRTLAEEAAERGAEFRTGVRVVGLRRSGGEVTGVETEAYDVEAPTVVCAAGWRARDLLSDAVSVPLRPWRINVCVLDVDGALPEDFPILHVEGGVTTRPKHDGTLRVGNVGGGVPDAPERLSSGGPATDEFVASAASDVAEVVPSFEGAEVVDHYSGIAGITPDVRPVVGEPAQAPDGLVVALGSGVGITCSPVVARGVRAAVCDDACPFPLDPFSPTRLDGYDPAFDVDELPGYWRPG
jgi:glycine/D-amino acid oxidase-like deaminating enzyme